MGADSQVVASNMVNLHVLATYYGMHMLEIAKAKNGHLISIVLEREESITTLTQVVALSSKGPIHEGSLGVECHEVGLEQGKAIT